MEAILGSYIIQIGIAVGTIVFSLGVTDLVVSGVRERRKRKALEARRAHQLLLAESLSGPIELLMTDREMAKDVYADLKARLDLKDDAPEALPEAEEPKKKKAQKRLPGKRRT